MLKYAAVALLLTSSAFAQSIDKARERAQFEDAAEVCALHVKEIKPDGSVVYETGYKDCYAIMHRKALLVDK